MILLELLAVLIGATMEAAWCLLLMAFGFGAFVLWIHLLFVVAGWLGRWG